MSKVKAVRNKDREIPKGFVRIDCPPELFDAEDAFVMRRKRVPVYRVNAIKSATQDDQLYKDLAVVFPKWQGITDVETGDELPNPEDDPTVFSRLDLFEQLPWFGDMLQVKPTNPKKSTRNRT